jgi:hypothetical protein
VRKNERYLAFPPAVPRAFLEDTRIAVQFPPSPLVPGSLSSRGQTVRHRGATLAYLAASSSFETADQLIRACMQVEPHAASPSCMHGESRVEYSESHFFFMIFRPRQYQKKLYTGTFNRYRHCGIYWFPGSHNELAAQLRRYLAISGGVSSSARMWANQPATHCRNAAGDRGACTADRKPLRLAGWDRCAQATISVIRGSCAQFLCTSVRGLAAIWL